jgi:hypothetical protein
MSPSLTTILARDYISSGMCAQRFRGLAGVCAESDPHRRSPANVTESWSPGAGDLAHPEWRPQAFVFSAGTFYVPAMSQDFVDKLGGSIESAFGVSVKDAAATRR